MGEAALQAARESISQEREEGEACLSRGLLREALAAFERMRDSAREARLGREEGQAQSLLAKVLDKLDAPEAEVEDAYKKALIIAHKQDDMELSFNTLMGMGSHAEKTGDLELAEHFYLQSLTLARRVLSEREEARAEGNLGMCFGKNEARRAECFTHFQKAIALQSVSDTSDQSKASLGLSHAAALGAQGRLREAKGEYERALALARAAGDSSLEGTALSGLEGLARAG